jgi:hypothetical protein
MRCNGLDARDHLVDRLVDRHLLVQTRFAALAQTFSLFSTVNL